MRHPNAWRRLGALDPSASRHARSAARAYTRRLPDFPDLFSPPRPVSGAAGASARLELLGASHRMTMATPFVIALRGALALLAAAPAEPGEAAVARKIVREIEQSLARLEGREATEADLISIVCHDLKDPLASIVMG